MDKLQDEFMAFWDEYKDKVGLGNYSDEVTRFWLQKIETTIDNYQTEYEQKHIASALDLQKVELLSKIKAIGYEEGIDKITVAKILNKLR